MKVGARASDLRLRVSAGSAEQIHFGRPPLPLRENRAVLLWGENDFLRRAAESFHTGEVRCRSRGRRERQGRK